MVNANVGVNSACIYKLHYLNTMNFEPLKKVIKENVKVISTLLVAIITALVIGLCSCSSTQRINVKQEQDGQIQETTIESDTKFKDVALVIHPKSIEYYGKTQKRTSD